MFRAYALALLVLVLGTTAMRASEVVGRVAMPDTCSPGVSPAVVVLSPLGGVKPQLRSKADSASVALVVNQRALQFEPRVQAMTLGRPLRFTNLDSETHNVHILADGTRFNQSMSPGLEASFTPERAGVLRLVCDIHTHMRGYIVVADSPWVAVCGRDGTFRLSGVPAGNYALQVWHEMGDGLRKQREIEVRDDRPVDIGTVEVAAATSRASILAAGTFAKWPDVIDEISVLLASSLDAASRPGGAKAARKRAEDAYFVKFHVSGMETAVRKALGIERAGALESLFYSFIREVKEAAEGRQSATKAADLSRSLLLALSRAAGDLNSQGIVDGSGHDSAFHGLASGSTPSRGDHPSLLAGLSAAFKRVGELADRDQPEDAASAMASTYFEEFEPIESELAARSPEVVGPLEARYMSIRGRVGDGLKGEPLAVELEKFQLDVSKAVARLDATPSGSFGPAFVASLGIILREGVELILLLSMLVSLAAKTGHPRSMSAIRWGVGLAAVASLLTALGLNLLVASTQGRTRELMEGSVMLAAAGVLFYVSYWLISKSESKRWTDFLKRQAKQGAEVGGVGALGLAAFLAVYREGAETALMYQAQATIFGQARAGMIGLGAGIGVGLALLALIYIVLRKASIRLPLQTFFKATGIFLFAMAVIFAGKGVFALQASELIKVTPLSWLGEGLPSFGIYPNAQAVAVQGLLLMGAALALVLLNFGGQSASVPNPRPTSNSPASPSSTAGVGI